MSDEKRPLFRTKPPFEIKAVEEPEVITEEYLKDLERQAVEAERASGLPFLYGWKWYDWARDFYESTNRINLLCAANQISKSSTQIRKCIHWATDKSIWSSLWQKKPVQFWYLYPGTKQVNSEFETKWKLFLPRREYKDDEYYGWKVERKNGDIVAIHFNSGVHVYFKTYAQKVEALASGTCDAIFCDEELPIPLFDELVFRLSASDGYFHMVFTAVLGQDEWRRAMEPTENDVEFLPDAFKQTVSLYDAQTFEDGSPSHWTLERIKKIEARCSTHNELLKRVHGKFIVDDEGRKCPTFDAKRHVKPKHPLPKGWLIYSGVDPGSGGKAHPAAICFVAVRPDYRAGRVFLGWRGDGIPTTNGDVVEKYIGMKKEANLQTASQRYDWGAKDFGTIATRMGEPFEKAEKGHDFGEDVVNTLFKHDMMFIYEDEELAKLSVEMTTLLKQTLKRNAKDNFYDSFRYAVASIPWDWSAITGMVVEADEDPEKPMNDMQRQIMERRKQVSDEDQREKQRVDDEFAEWNEAYGNEY